MPRRVAAPRKLRTRLTVAFVLVAAVAAGALAGGTYLLVRRARLSDSASTVVDQVRRNVEVAGLILEAPRPKAETTRELLGRLGTESSETVAIVRGVEFGSISHTFGEVPADLVGLVRQGNLAYERVTIRGVPYIVAGAPVDGRRTSLFTFVSEQTLFDDLSQLGFVLLAGWGVVVLLAGLVGAVLARRTLAPVARASDAARLLAEGLLETRLPEGGNDEFGAWASSFNEMAQALESKIDALQQARDRERRFTSDVSHELRTPLTALVGEASVLREHIERMPQEARRPAEMLVSDVGRLRRLVEELMEISRLDADGALRLEHVDLRSLIDGVIRSHGWNGRVRTTLEPVMLETDRRRLERVVSNLVGNAVEHGASDVTVTAGIDDGGLRMEVADHGPGIGPEDLRHVFERFYKADPSRSSRGSGLGLAIALENARLLGGDIAVRSRVGVGTRFTLTLPVTQRLPRGEPAVSSALHDEATTGEKGGVA
ncbi:MAG: ATP-binding protein [Actinomycetota bacterium]